MKPFKYADKKQATLYKKFPTNHFLSNPTNLDHTYLWCTFFRRNLHRYAQDYLGIKLHFYQAVILYLMGISKMICIIACRSAAKSFVIGVYNVCIGGLYPNAQMVLSSKTIKQASLIITKKIIGELIPRSPMLKKEILECKTNPDIIVNFRSGATISIAVASDGGRGVRSNFLTREEFRLISKNVEDSVLSPMQVVRQVEWMQAEPYNNLDYCVQYGLQEEPIDIYISSSWLDSGHWMWDIVDLASKEMLTKDNVFLLSFDESIPLKYNIKTQKQLQTEYKKQDALTWRTEFLNERVKENTSAMFTYKMLMDNQRLKKPFYPLREGQEKPKSYNRLEKQDGEIRIISCDFAFIENKGNDNSVFSCIRALPESSSYKTNGRDVEVKKGYRRQVSYIEHRQGGELEKQAIRVRQLYEDFDADYIVLDGQNNGLGIYEYLAKVLYDEERDIEYSPLSAINDESFKNRISNENAKDCIFVIRASDSLNGEIARQFRQVLNNSKIDFLVSLNTAKEDILGKNIKEYSYNSDYEEQIYFENPFLETQLMINETAELVSIKRNGYVVPKEVGRKTKDRYTSVSYGSYFIDTLEREIYSDSTEDDFSAYKSCVSSVSF